MSVGGPPRSCIQREATLPFPIPSILLGLAFLVAADIIRTVSELPSLGRVAVLAGIVGIRTFLSFTLEVELEGRWPWQRHASRTKKPATGRSRAASLDPDEQGEAEKRVLVTS